jgi:hypothetical protein
MRPHLDRFWPARHHFWLVALSAATLGLLALLFLAARSAGAVDAQPDAAGREPLMMVVMDPLALPLACPCVQGYAQRKYEKLAERLEQALRRPVKIVFNESLTAALKGDAQGRADLVIGKHSVVLFDAHRADLSLQAIASLTGKDGATTQTGLIVVPTDDVARSVADLRGYRIVFGPVECDEKHAAALALLKHHGVEPPAVLETSPACSDGACAILDDAKKVPDRHGAAVISSYAKPLLEGCGTVEKGSLRVVGQTEPVAFVEAFVNAQRPEAERTALVSALLESTADPQLRIALETRDGFVAIASQPAAGKVVPVSAAVEESKKK